MFANWLKAIYWLSSTPTTSQIRFVNCLILLTNSLISSLSVVLSRSYNS